MPVVTKTNELSVLVSVYNKFSLFNDHSVRLFFHVYMNANELCLIKKSFQDSRLPHHLIREIKTFLKINHITVDKKKYCIFYNSKNSY